MRILTFSTLYPSAARPTHGIFVETRLRKLVESGAVSARVVAPCPWFPLTSPKFGTYSAFARTPRRETRHGIEIEHPRYPLLPKIGMSRRRSRCSPQCCRCCGGRCVTGTIST